MLHLDDYTYDLPDDRIAQTLADPADSCKLLVYAKRDQSFHDAYFFDLPTIIDPEKTHFVFNTSKVLQARLPLPSLNGEIFYLRSVDPYTFEALVRPGKKFRVWETISLDETDIMFTIQEQTANGRLLTCSHPVMDVLEQHGQLPLPPYIEYEQEKATAYQPVFAKDPGSVAAPTASLHFTEQLLDELKIRGATFSEIVLHVGLGTFKQVDTDDITTYDIHEETAHVDLSLFEDLARSHASQKTLVWVGTTVTRTLESLPFLRALLSETECNTLSQEARTRRDACSADIAPETAQKTIPYRSMTGPMTVTFTTKCYLYPGIPFRVITALLTNFHLPKSSLLMLVAGFMGYDEMRRCYDHAIANNYLFYSFGDAMLVR